MAHATADRVTVDTEVIGHHGYHPPEFDIHRAVLGWLPGALEEGATVLSAPSAPSPDAPRTYTLRIKCCRQKVRGFVGVKAVCVPMGTSVELRVHPPGGQWQWPCFLNCPTQELAVALFASSRPDAMRFMTEEVRDRLMLDNTVPRRKGGCNVDRPRQERIIEQISRDVTRPPALERFSWQVQQYLTESCNTTVTGTLAVRFAVVAIGRPNTPPVIAGTTLMPLVAAGVIDPTPLTNGSWSFQPTMLVAEYAARHALQLAKQEQERLQRQITSEQQLLESSRRRQLQLRAQLDAEQDSQRISEGKLWDLEAQLADLPTPDESD